MRKIVLTVATVVLLYALAVGAGPAAPAPRASTAPVAPIQSSAWQSNQPEVQTFLGTITKIGKQFVFSEDDATKSSYRLDDQDTASKFEGRKVKVTGTLDVASNIIRVQSIEVSA